MKDIRKEIDEFFSRYEKLFEEGLDGNLNAAAICDAFAECFIAANPTGVTCGKNGDEFRQAIPKGYDFYRNAGMHAMKLDTIVATAIDDHHWLVKVHWRAYFHKKDNSELALEFDVNYFLQDLDGALKIFGYVTGDEQGMLQEHGLLPE